jgi:hypothetical protein
MLELEELKLSCSVEGYTLGAKVPGRHEHCVDEESTAKSYHAGH